jgi:hypothetical protein
MRAFLSNYIWNQPEPVPVNELHRLGIGDAVTAAFAKFAKGNFNPSDPVQTTSLRMPLLKAVNANGADVNFVKTHNQNTMAFGHVLIPPELTKSAIYIMRDPRDMIISYASHLGMTLDAAIAGMNSKDNATNGDAQNVHQYLGRWSDHVTSWTRTKKFPVLAIRYEDMLRDPEKTFSSVVRRVGMPVDKGRLRKAIDFSSFKKLKQQEEEVGFVENSKNQERFFRKGSSGHYEDELTAAQISQIEKDHEKIMRRHGYLR